MDPSEPEVRFTETIRRSDRVRIGLIAGAVLVAVCSVAVAFAASPSPSPSGASPDASAVAVPTPTTGSPSPTDASPNAPAATTAPTPSSGTHKSTDGTHGFRFGFGGLPFAGRGGGSVFGPITVTAVNGSNVSLKTADGWTRTITVGDSTTVTRGGAPAKVGDIKVGDTVRLDQDRASDGTYTVTRIDVILRPSPDR